MSTYDWATGRVNPLLNTFGPRQPQTVIPGMTSRTVIPTFHTYTPQKGGWTLPKGTTLGFTPLKGYYARPGAPAPPAATGAAKAGTGIPTIDAIIKQIYGTIESPADQEARVKREVADQVAAQQKMIEDMYARQRADALRTMQAQSLAGQAAAAMSKDLLGAVGGEYNEAAGEIKGLSHGLTGATGKATAGDVAAANTGLQAMAGGGGNVAVEAGPGGGPLAPGGALQAGVEDYRAGTLGSQLLTSEGQAATFGLAGQTAAQNLRATQEAEAELHTTLQDLRGKESDAINALAAGRADLYQKFKAEAADSKIKALTLVQGLIAQKQANAQATAKLAAQYNRDLQLQRDRDRRFGLNVAKAKVSASQGQQRIAQGDKRIAQGDARIAISNAQLTIAQQKEMRQALKDAVASGQVDVNRSKALKYVVDKTGKAILDANGKKIPSTLLGAGKPPVTGNQLANLVQNWHEGKAGTVRIQATNKDGKPVWNRDGSPKMQVITTAKGKLGYQQAYQRLRAMKVDDVQARQALNTAYRRGESGRPYLDVIDRNVLRAAKLNQTAIRLTKAQLASLARQYPEFADPNTHASNVVLTPQQVAALEAAGRHLDGWWVSGSYGGGTTLGRRYLLKEGY